MSALDLLAFNAVLAAAILSPGPALLFALRTALADGRAAGIAAGLGLGLVAALWTLAALLGLEALFSLFPWAYMALKIAGAAYLLYIAWTTWRAARQPVTDGARKPRGRAFLDGALINLGNPKSVLFAASVLVVIFPKGLSASDIALITVNHMMVEWLFYAGFATLLSGATARRAYLGAKPTIDRAAALLLGALGLKLLLSRD
ncbi:MAG: lysine transporter LysE [Alphaproteobacteria bacterium HGW-Alphaproteobacteria-1]|jgi:threonine/homoserine/homoserine lactone efflux protein|nr:MAG: lysine transporter LysE [Alphaproteobacteria bacterium HGW-Alphaproteobacteria-1]